MRIRKQKMWPESSAAASGHSGAPSFSGDRLDREPAKAGGAPLWETLDEGALVLVKEPGTEATVATIADITIRGFVLGLRLHNGMGRRLFHCEDEVRLSKQFVP